MHQDNNESPFKESQAGTEAEAETDSVAVCVFLHPDKHGRRVQKTDTLSGKISLLAPKTLFPVLIDHLSSGEAQRSRTLRD